MEPNRNIQLSSVNLMMRRTIYISKWKLQIRIAKVLLYLSVAASSSVNIKRQPWLFPWKTHLIPANQRVGANQLFHWWKEEDYSPKRLGWSWYSLHWQKVCSIRVAVRKGIRWDWRKTLDGSKTFFRTWGGGVLPSPTPTDKYYYIFMRYT